MSPSWKKYHLPVCYPICSTISSLDGSPSNATAASQTAHARARPAWEVPILFGDKANCCQHAHTAVLQLTLTKPLHLTGQALLSQLRPGMRKLGRAENLPCSVHSVQLGFGFEECVMIFESKRSERVACDFVVGLFKDDHFRCFLAV